jgi:sulfoxide reductase catalytic subunit YedY
VLASFEFSLANLIALPGERMLCKVKSATEPSNSELTPKSLYLNRRNFLAGLITTGAAIRYAHCARPLHAQSMGYGSSRLDGVTPGRFSTKEQQTPYFFVTHYNNFYEFGSEKEQPAENARNFRTSPWSLTVDGEVSRPRTFTMDEIMKLAPLEERIYRHRCVEAWSIVVPWIGYSFSALAKLVQPTSKAKFIAFESYYDPARMPEAPYAGIDFPYVEGLRMDEAMNPLTLLCVGMYGEKLPNQDGAPVRMVIPWKYGIKSIKSLVKISFVQQQPRATWNAHNPHEYGFYANVNPQVDHPRWSQEKERRLGELGKRPTLMFNGYADQVAKLYSGMDLRKDF